MNSISNPEFLRYVRSELRPARAAVIVLSTLAGALLMAMFIFEQNQRPGAQDYMWEYWGSVFGAIFVASSMILVLWSLLNVSQSVVSERTHRTFDFWRTTRLSPLTLALGKLFGAPLGPWLLYATAFPVLLLTGLLGHYRLSAIVGSYLVVALFNVALSAIALCGSARAQDSRRANIFMLLTVIGLIVTLNMAGRHGASSAWTSLSPATGIAEWLQGTMVRVSLFGMSLPSVLVTVLLSLAVIAWCLVALVRCLKFEPDQISLFSPAQVVGVSASALLFVYAAFQPVGAFITAPNLSANDPETATLTLQSLVGIGLAAALACLYFAVNATLFTRDNLRHELRNRVPSEVGLRVVAPWLATGFVSILAAVIALVGYRSMFAGAAPQWFNLFAMYLSVIAYVTRDGMFLQWMVSQKIKAPVLKGSALLACYYAGSFVVAAVIAGPPNAIQMLRWLTPYVFNVAPGVPGPGWMILVFLVPPIATAVLLAFGVFRSMQRASKAATELVQA
jgi:hypothetical protein